MTVAELIQALLHFDGSLQVKLYADQEGLTTMEPESVSVQRDYRGDAVVLISAWEPSGDEPL